MTRRRPTGLCSSNAAAEDAAAGRLAPPLQAAQRHTEHAQNQPPIAKHQSGNKLDQHVKPIRASDLHELTDGEQVSQSDVIAAEERLSAEKHGLQFVQSVIELRQRTNQTPLVQLGASLSREEHLRQVETEKERQTSGDGDTERQVGTETGGDRRTSSIKT